MNGLHGICRGFTVSTGRRSVYLFDRKQTVSIKPDNLKLVGNCSSAKSDHVKLCDVQDRLGGYALLDTFMINRGDAVAKILLEEHNASIDLCDVDGNSARALASISVAPSMSEVAALVSKYALRRGRAEKLRHESTCSNCAKAGDSLLECSKCHSVYYCCKECQVTHWRSGGHKQFCNQLSSEKQGTVVLEKPLPGGPCLSQFCVSTFCVPSSRIEQQQIHF
jgi:hypothetical protein